MNAPVTRRALLGATAAVGAVALPAVVEAAAATHPDAALLDLIARHPAAVAHTDALTAACEGPFARFHAMAPERPAALDFRASDFCHDLPGAHGRERGPDGTVRSFYDISDIARLEAAPPVTKWGDFADDEPPRRVPDPAGQARRREILDAQARWDAARGAVAERVGLRAANQACDAALEAEVEVENAIAAAVPVTPRGFRAKAAWVVATPSEEAGERALALLRALPAIDGAAP